MQKGASIMAALVKDRIFEAHLAWQHERAKALDRDSDLVDIVPAPGEGMPPQRYVAMFHSRGLVCNPGGRVTEASEFAVGIYFPHDYLRRGGAALDGLTFDVISLLRPINVWHPNVRYPAICAGHLVPGMAIDEILTQVFEILTYQRKNMREDDSLNPAAARWARNHQDMFPIDPRPLRRRAVNMEVEAIAGPKGGNA
jgi:hypothetical protein